MSGATTYPPPPLHPDSTLYSASPHSKKDKLLRKQLHSTTHTDPFYVVLFILFLGLFLAWKPEYIPFSSSSSSSSSLKGKNSCSCDIVVPTPKMVWQKTFTLPSASRGCHLITSQVEKEISEGLKGCKAGILTLFIQHTSASLTINENFDPDVRKDMDMAMDKVISESLPINPTFPLPAISLVGSTLMKVPTTRPATVRCSAILVLVKMEEPAADDDSDDLPRLPAKASLFGPTVTIPITDGRMNLGTWQGVMLCEWRAAKHSRRIVATILP